jgi:type IV pilus assembly protein PilE
MKTKLASLAFTLVELLVVMAIIAVLLAIAYPNYSTSIQKSRRTEGRGALLDYATRFEEFYGTNYTYTGADTYTGLNTTPQTDNKYYKISATIPAGGTTYTITATAINSQAKDTACTTMTINETNQKLPATCW